jgi:Tol biopolymer transport system component
MPAFAPDGRWIAFCRLPGYANSEVYLMPVSKNVEAIGEPQRLATAGRGASNPVWTHDGKHILYVGPRQELKIIPVSGFRQAKPVPVLEENISELSLGRHLVYARRAVDNNIWRAELRPAGVPLSVPQRLVASTRSDMMPQYSPDGRKIAFASARSGTWEIWMAEEDGSNPVALTPFGGPPGVLAWSPDGRQIAFGSRSEGQSDLFTIPTTGGTRKRLTTDPADDLIPSYSHDGRWIYFMSKRSGQSQIWRMPSAGGAATRITFGQGGYMPMESTDGKTLFYCHDLPEKGIWKVPVDGGKETQVAGPYSARLCGLAVTAEGFYYTAAPDARKRHSIQFVSFSTGTSRAVVVSDRPVGKLALSVSPDGRFIIYAQSDQLGSDLMLIENFDPVSRNLPAVVRSLLLPTQALIWQSPPVFPLYAAHEYGGVTDHDRDLAPGVSGLPNTRWRPARSILRPQWRPAQPLTVSSPGPRAPDATPPPRSPPDCAAPSPTAPEISHPAP